MNDDVLVRVEGARKKFCRSLKKSLWYGVCDVVREAFPKRRDRPAGGVDRDGLRPGEFWAVKDASFELRRGECLGLIGSNGAGKTTLLKMLNGLIKPDAGRIAMRGRVGALIALGAGFNPLLTGRENIYVNASVLGLTRREVDARIDEIIEFAGIGEFIEAPVQSYSSGMQVRLGFAVASSLEPEILLADEVLAVGDANFRAKCYRRLAELRAAGSTILLVSHQMADIQRMCTRAIWMRDGMIAAMGEMGRVASEYQIWSDRQSAAQALKPTAPQALLSGAHVIAVHMLDVSGEPESTFATGDTLRVRVEYEVQRGLEALNFSVSFTGNEDALYNGYISLHDGLTVRPVQTRGHVDLVFPRLCFGAGQYWVNVSLSDKDHFGLYDWRWQICGFSVRTNGPMLGRIAFPHYWEGSETPPIQKFSVLL